jgi:uncharacterized protein YbjQ (UPF0145 family)
MHAALAGAAFLLPPSAVRWIIRPGQHMETAMIITSTESVDGRTVAGYLGIVSGETILGANIFKDFFAGIRDIVGGRSGAYEKVLKDAKRMALEDMAAEARELGADAIVAVDLDYEVIGGDDKTMLMVSANGTAVKLR